MPDNKLDMYEQVCAYLLQIPKFTKKHDKDHTKQFLEKLGNPGEHIRKIHVAGTNGKGSVCAYMESVLEQAGYKTGVFTSPHLIEMTERIHINGKEVSKEAFVNAFYKVKNTMEKEILSHPTFFEYLFFMGMVLFEEAKINVMILETGLGGRLDATNVYENTDICVLTKIGLDHMEYLGNTFSQIAVEKAGIIKEKSVVISTVQRNEVMQVIKEIGARKHAKMVFVDEKKYTLEKIHDKSIDFSYKSRYYGYIRFCVFTCALYQVENASVALTAIEMFDTGKKVTLQNLINGILNTVWAGRMEEIAPNIYIDGAHNEDGMTAFLNTVIRKEKKGKNILLFSAVSDKDYNIMIQMLVRAKLFDEFVITKLQNMRGVSVNKMQHIFNKYKVDTVTLYADVKDAFAYVTQKKNDTVYIVGSLYLAGQIKALLKEGL